MRMHTWRSPASRLLVATVLLPLPGAAGTLTNIASVTAFEQFVDTHERALVGVFHPCTSACEVFQGLAGNGHTTLALAAAYGPLAAEVLADVDIDGLEQPEEGTAAEGPLAEVLLFPGWSDPVQRFNGSWTLVSLLSWIRKHRYPAVHQLSRETHRSLVQQSGRAVLWLFVDPQAGAKTEGAFASAQRCAAAYPTRLSALYTTGDSPSGQMLQRTVGLEGAGGALPTLAIQEVTDGTPRSFVFPEGAPLDGTEVETFCNDFVSGALARADAETVEEPSLSSSSSAPGAEQHNASDPRQRDEL